MPHILRFCSRNGSYANTVDSQLRKCRVMAGNCLSAGGDGGATPSRKSDIEAALPDETHPHAARQFAVKVTELDVWLSKLSTTTKEAVCDPTVRLVVTFS